MPCQACSSIAYGYLRHGRGGQGPLLWGGGLGGPSRRGAALALQALGLAGAGQLLPRLQLPVTLGHRKPDVSEAKEMLTSKEPPTSTWDLQPQCPMDFAGERARTGGEDVTGALRVTRHPALMSMALFCAGASVATPF
eukprot:SAG31_NODE_2140_length_6350_cov_2.239962_7_plen_137_part_01